MRKRRAIIIDDDATIIELYQDIFRSLDYEVLTLAEPVVCPIYGEHAAACNKSVPCADLMITDYQMPGMNGLDLLEAQLKKGCKLTIRNKALITGYDDSGILQRVQNLTCAYFQKPVAFTSLIKWVAECEKRMDLSLPLVTLRKESRLTTRPEMQCRLSFNDHNLVCTALNVSESGCCLKVPFPLDSEQIVRINTESSMAFRPATVRWIMKQHDGMYLAGLICS